MDLFTLSRKNIFARPLNSFMSVLLLALSIALIVFILLFNSQFKKGLENNLAGIDLVIGAKGSPLQLILNSMYHIDAPTGNVPLEEAIPFLNPQHPLISAAIPLSLGDSYGSYRIAGAPPDILNLYGIDQIHGNIYTRDFEVVVGATVANKIHLHIGDEFHSTHGFEENPDLAHDHSSPFVVTGILPPSGTILDQLILCTPQTVWKVHEHAQDSSGTNEEHLHDHSESHQHHIPPLTAIDSNQMLAVTDSVLAALRLNPEKEITSLLIRYKNRTSIPALNFARNINQNTGLMAASPAIEMNRLYSMMGSGADAITYLAFAIGIVAAISVFISLYTSLRERRYEMALMRVSGALPSKIFSMILYEALWISISGILLGLILGHVGMEITGRVLADAYRYPFTGWTWMKEELLIVLAAILITLLAAVIPAIEGSRTELHKTLAEN